MMRCGHGLHKLDADQAIDAGGEGQFTAGKRQAIAARTQDLGEVRIEVGESFQEALWMAKTDPREPGGVVVKGAQAVREDGRNPGQVLDFEVVRILVLPLEASFFTIRKYHNKGCGGGSHQK